MKNGVLFSHFRIVGETGNLQSYHQFSSEVGIIEEKLIIQIAETSGFSHVYFYENYQLIWDINTDSNYFFDFLSIMAQKTDLDYLYDIKYKWRDFPQFLSENFELASKSNSEISVEDLPI
ncbi:MAG: hypothetical protein ACQET8_17115 [Bacillota bacterium]